MGALLSSTNSHRVTDKDRAVLDLKVQRDKLKQYSKKIQLVLDKEVQAAKDLLQAGNKQRALLALKKKKYQEQLLLKTDQQLLQLEQLTQAIEFALVEQQVLKGLETGNQVLKSIHQELSLDNVEKLMMDTQDAIEYQREIDEALSGSLSLEDQEAIEAELDALVAIELRETEHNLPQVPVDDIVDQTSKEKMPEFPQVPSTNPQEATKVSAKEKQATKKTLNAHLEA